MENAQEKKLQASPISRALDTTTQIVSNKRSRSIIFLIISFLLILGINALLPLIEGESHYTAESVSGTHSAYITALEEDPNIKLTWDSEQKVAAEWAKWNAIPLPRDSFNEYTKDLMVSYYTKFFFQTALWYITTLTSLVSALLLYYSIFNYLTIRSKDTYPKYLTLEKEVSRLTNTSLDPIVFEDWMEHDFNSRRKINQHKANIKYKLDKLERRTHYKVKHRCKFLKEDEQPIKWIDKQYMNRKRKLLSLLEQDYINQYVVNGRVPYFKYVFPMFVYNGDNTGGKTVDSYSNINTDSERISKDASKKVVVSLSITLLFATLLTVTVMASIQQSPMWIVFNIISKIVPLFIQIPLAINYNQSYMGTHLMGNLYSRRAIAFLFLAEHGNSQPLIDATRNDKEGEPHA